MTPIPIQFDKDEQAKFFKELFDVIYLPDDMDQVNNFKNWNI